MDHHDIGPVLSPTTCPLAIHSGADPGILERRGEGAGSLKRQVHRNFQTDKQKHLGGGGKVPNPLDPPLKLASVVLLNSTSLCCECITGSIEQDEFKVYRGWPRI